MTKAILLIIVMAFMSSCQTWDISKLKMTKEPISPRLLTLDRKIEDVANTTVVTNTDQMLLFTKEVEENLIDPFGDKFGYIIMKQTVLKMKPGIFIPSAVLLYIPVLLGAPFAIPKESIEIELRIMDSHNKLIGKYSAIGKAKNVCAFYYGYSLLSVGRKTYADAVLDAFNQIRTQIKSDTDRLNQKLQESGKMN